jgi:hypothetical protein
MLSLVAALLVLARELSIITIDVPLTTPDLLK